MSQDFDDFLEDDEKEEEDREEYVIESNTGEVVSTEEHSQENTLLAPVSDIDDVVSVYDQFEEIKEKLLDSPDTALISGNPYVNKSGWRKISTAFNLSVEVVNRNLWVEDGIVKAEVEAKATAPNGKSASALGRCGSNESNFMESHSENRNKKPSFDDIDPDDIVWVDGAWREIKSPRGIKEHDILTLAATRAKNRAISDCVGGGEVSAEEITADDVL